MIISPFTPLFFISQKADGIESAYIQTFATTDRILVQIIGSAVETVEPCILYDEPSHTPIATLEFSHWSINDNTIIWFIELSPAVGMYSVEINGITSQIFRVTDDKKELARTTLIQYSMHNNRQRDDAVFYIDNMHYFFDFRVPGGFKDSNWSFSVENEQFVTDRSDIVQLYGLDSVQQKFTMGTSMGCPVWFGALLNRLLTCTYVYFDGIRYARKESSVPELSVQLEGVNSFVFTQNLQQVVNLNPSIERDNHLIMRRTPTDYRQITTDIYRKI